ncbi:hypothetical protein D9756_007117 [Leucocoprinus leucothites]|uniref:Pyridoxamine 5'-phosphate oxidase N-terminal domain-containing protein n=1 Tax=Leucocoprinus leucothites TaxID=201217 RepID=A0A8H5FYY4_9AGAR|nr:hypothetical protein D9756_007117 [Leucoagaricus leucothites]
MVKYYESIPDFVVPWIKEQKVFWVATAPLTGDGHVNVSPKGIFDGNFGVVNERQVWYEDLTGSGIETISHLRENGRITVMFTAFDGPPRICRLFGKGTVYEFGTPEYDSIMPPEKRQPGSRSVIFVDVYQVSTSCGYSIPYYSFEGYRLRLHGWAAQLQNADNEAEEEVNEQDGPATEKGIKHYWKNRNAKSLDGLPGLKDAPDSKHQFCFIDPKTVQQKEQASKVNAKTQGWIDRRTVAAFALGAVASVSVLKMLGRR